MNRTTYVYPGMIFISPEEAREILEDGCTCYRLNDDNSEAMLHDAKEVEDDLAYGYEIEEFDFDRYFENRIDENGNVLFSHGTDDVDSLLDISEEFLYFASQGGTLRQTMKDGAAMMVRRIRDSKASGNELQKKATFGACIRYIEAITPFGWRFGAFDNNGLDYVFQKEPVV